MIETVRLVEKWAEEKGIARPVNIPVQYVKCVEELTELGAELENAEFFQDSDYPEIFHAYMNDAEMELGDCLVTLIILAKDMGTTAEECLERAYQKIRNRKGKVINGTFVKEEDLNNKGDK